MMMFGDNRRRDLSACFSKWKRHCHEAAKADGEAAIYVAVQEIAVVKQRALELTEVNTKLAEENDNLRQYTLDGFHVAKDVQLLSNQRDVLKMDLMAKDETIQRLLDDQRLLRK